MWIWRKFLQPWYNWYFGIPDQIEDKEKKKVENNKDDKGEEEGVQNDPLYCTSKNK